jgi:ataxia telangiectasia mutated family protein
LELAIDTAKIFWFTKRPVLSCILISGTMSFHIYISILPIPSLMFHLFPLRRIVFEQGKLLNSPERVPFRLTRNIVDGMGPSGVEGTFITSAQETTRVLRKNTAALLTILSAVAADPLFKWSLSPVQARARQIVDDEEANAVVDASVSGLQSDTVPMEDQNKVALKEIAKIKAKLQGYEDSTSGEQHGVLGQVLLLTNSARDADHLSEMFPGWSPWI